MNSQMIWGVLVAIAIVCAFVFVWYELKRRRTARLRGRFGPEYQQAVERAGNIANAERNLESRMKRVERLHIRPLPPEDATRFASAWRQVQAEFVDRPEAAVASADRLVGEVMAMRGYPLGEFEQRVEDISVDHPGVVMHYRAARDLAEQRGRGQGTTEDLRQAMVHYHELFNDLLGPSDRKPEQQPESADAELTRK